MSNDDLKIVSFSDFVRAAVCISNPFLDSLQLC